MRDLILILMLTCYTSQVLGIKCFDCNSLHEPRCSDPFDNSTISFVDCDSKINTNIDEKSTFCRKTLQKGA